MTRNGLRPWLRAAEMAIDDIRTDAARNGYVTHDGEFFRVRNDASQHTADLRTAWVLRALGVDVPRDLGLGSVRDRVWRVLRVRREVAA